LIDNQVLSEELGAVNCTLSVLILFGKKNRVKKIIPQSGISAVEYDSLDADVADRFRKEINGARYHRNQTIVDYLRDMNFIESSGRGVSRKIIRGMIEHNGKEPDFELRGESLRVTLYS